MCLQFYEKSTVVHVHDMIPQYKPAEVQLRIFFVQVYDKKLTPEL